MITARHLALLLTYELQKACGLDDEDGRPILSRGYKARAPPTNRGSKVPALASAIYLPVGYMIFRRIRAWGMILWRLGWFPDVTVGACTCLGGLSAAIT